MKFLGLAATVFLSSTSVFAYCPICDSLSDLRVIQNALGSDLSSNFHVFDQIRNLQKTSGDQYAVHSENGCILDLRIDRKFSSENPNPGEEPTKTVVLMKRSGKCAK